MYFVFHVFIISKGQINSLKMDDDRFEIVHVALAILYFTALLFLMLFLLLRKSLTQVSICFFFFCKIVDSFVFLKIRSLTIR